VEHVLVLLEELEALLDAGGAVERRVNVLLQLAL
jgi:hypothetical protein